MKYTSLALSGVSCAGKSTLLRNLNVQLKHLGKDWSFFSMGDMLRERHQKTETDQAFDEWYREEVLPNPEYSREINYDLGDKVRYGEVKVADTRFVREDLFPETTLRAFLHCPLPIRARRVMKREDYKDFGFEETKKRIHQRDLDVLNMGKLTFEDDYDYRDDKHFHLKIDTNKHSKVETAKLILDKLEL